MEINNINSPEGTSTVTVLRSLTLPIPSHDLQCAPGGTVLPVPWQVEHVLAIWKPELMTKVWVPDP